MVNVIPTEETRILQSSLKYIDYDLCFFVYVFVFVTWYVDMFIVFFLEFVCMHISGLRHNTSLESCSTISHDACDEYACTQMRTHTRNFLYA